MKFVIFGITISSPWGNGHTTLWRGHRIAFFERDVPYYAAHRNLFEIAGGRLVGKSGPKVRSINSTEAILE